MDKQVRPDMHTLKIQDNLIYLDDIKVKFDKKTFELELTFRRATSRSKQLSPYWLIPNWPLIISVIMLAAIPIKALKDSEPVFLATVLTSSQFESDRISARKE